LTHYLHSLTGRTITNLRSNRLRRVTRPYSTAKRIHLWAMILSPERSSCPSQSMENTILVSSHWGVTTQSCFRYSGLSIQSTDQSPSFILTLISVYIFFNIESDFTNPSIPFTDTWKPSVFGGAPSSQAEINHGTYFYWASQEGLINNGTSIASIAFSTTITTTSSFT